MTHPVLLYHDVVLPGEETSSGFQGGDADRYKLDTLGFASHLEAIAARGAATVFSFDDGGIGAIQHTAPMLEAHGWRGIFFITTDRIGEPGFLGESDIRALRDRGHRIGSHSCSHPPRMSACSREQLLNEWSHSRARLESILGESVTVASIPGGYYSRLVAETAAQAGIRELHTSEPVATRWTIGSCTLVGRFSITCLTPPSLAAAYAAGDRLPRWRLAAFWQTKKVIKAVGGTYWLRLRRALLRHRNPS